MLWGAFHSTKNSVDSGLGSEWNRHFPEFHSEILGVPREVGLKFRKIGITGKFCSIRPFLLVPRFSETGNRNSTWLVLKLLNIILVLWRYVQKCTQQQKWQNFANNNLEANANEKARGPPWKASEFGEFGESGKNGKLVKIDDNNLEANANEKTRGPPCKAGDFGEFRESGKNGKLVKIADNNLEANVNEKTRGPP